MLENRGREGEPPLFLLPGEERERERERAISTALQTSSAVSFRSSPSAFSFHKLVRLDSDPMERSIHRGTISISPGSSVSVPCPLPIIEGKGEVWVLLNGRSNHWLPSDRFVPSCCLRFSESIHGY